MSKVENTFETSELTPRQKQAKVKLCWMVLIY